MFGQQLSHTIHRRISAPKIFLKNEIWAKLVTQFYEILTENAKKRGNKVECVTTKANQYYPLPITQGYPLINIWGFKIIDRSKQLYDKVTRQK